MQLLEEADGATIDASQTMYPSALTVRKTGAELSRPRSTTYGYVTRGSVFLRSNAFEGTLRAGGFFSIAGAFSVEIKSGTLVEIERFGFRGMNLAGAIEDTGRLAYIDGCSDSILCLPPRLGDPVLNHLHFPARIDQSLHRHPSIRLGVVARGAGVAHGANEGPWEKPLREGDVFMLAAHELHAFRTSDRAMDVIAFHPDSDWGPTDAAHPMLTRTYLAK